MTTKVLFTGKTENTAGPNGSSRSSDNLLDLRLPNPHPAAENLFGAAWSQCYMAAVQFVAAQRRVTLPELPAVRAEIDLMQDSTGYFLAARLDVSLPGVDREVGKALVEAAHAVCPYSKAVHGNIAVQTTLA